MTVVSFDVAACARIRRRLDAYLSDELALDAAAEVERHLAGCERCSAEFAAMEDSRNRLRRAVRSEAVPADLRDAVRGRLERDGRRRVAPWLAVAAALALTVGGGYVVSKRLTGFYPHKLLAIELEVRSLVRQVAAAYAPAIIDHVHCALYRAGSKSEVMPEKVAMELGEQAPIAGIVQQAGQMLDQGEIAVGRNRGIGNQLPQNLAGAGEGVQQGYSLTKSLRSTEHSACAGPESPIRMVSVVSRPQLSIHSAGMKWNTMPGCRTVSSSVRIEAVRSPQSGG